MTEPIDPHLRTRAAMEDARRDLQYPAPPEALVVPVYDNHTHLEIADGENPMHYREHLDRGSAVGVRGVIQVGTDVLTSRWSAAVAEREPRVLAAVAIHPNEAPTLDAAGELDDALAVIDDEGDDDGARLVERGRVGDRLLQINVLLHIGIVVWPFESPRGLSGQSRGP